LIGKTLGHYEIIAPIGRGGMGEVYRARDSKLGRDVAIKVLPDVLARDPDLIARFRREAKLLAALNHPNIASIHELGQDGGAHFLVMELVEGPGLDQLVSTEPMAIDEALRLFSQIAEALEYAHERGIVHRDLKPANIKITGDGRAKILDFGLGKALETAPVPAGTEDGTVPLDSNSEASSLRTGRGQILGTPAYMSPEQARGLVVDKRADIWAFGCCLFEALSGTRAFQGATATDLLAEIIKGEPDWDALPGNTPARVRILLWRCLQKDPRRRLRDIGEARIELSGEWSDPSGILPALEPTANAKVRLRWSMLLATAIALAAGAIVTGTVTWSIMRHRAGSSGRSETEPVSRFEIDIGKTVPLGMQTVSAEVAISPDGRRLAYTANVDGRRRLYLRDLDRLQAERLPGTENAWRPFFSPDGQWIGFFVPGSPSSRTGKLMKIATQGGDPLELCPAFPPAGATWLADDSIVFTGQDDGTDLTAGSFSSDLFRVSASGGVPEKLAKPDAMGRGERTFILPHSIPGRDAFLFTVLDTLNRPDVALYDLHTGKYTTVVERGLNAQFVPPGYLVFARTNALWAATFDPGSRAVGQPIVVQSDIQEDRVSETVPFAVSGEGSLVFAPLTPAREPLRTPVWVDHEGREETIALPPALYWWPRVSPDGSRVALSILEPQDKNQDIWIHQFERALSMTRVTFDPGQDTSPFWAPDARYLYFASSRTGSLDLFRRRADGTGAVEAVLAYPGTKYPADISPDGSTLLFGDQIQGESWKIMALPLSASGERSSAPRKPWPVLAGQFNAGGARLSPDGTWLAYNTDETNPTQVFVRPYPNVDSGRWQVSTDGGINPSWSRDGKEIYYRHGSRMMAVSVQTAPEFRPGSPRVLFEGDYYYAPDLSVQYDLEYPGRRRFLMLKQAPDTDTTKLVYVGGWASELRGLVPIAR
jgi:serine/threonine protein kinase/Tol biopolymer transport system component